MADYQRPPDSFFFKLGGVYTRDVADAIPPTKQAIAQNVRSTGENSIRTRPGYNTYFAAGANAVLNLRGYATLGTDSTPRLLAYTASGNVRLDNNASVGNMGGNAGFGASMLPFRPAESPQAWMYIGTQGDYQKFSAPSANNVVTAYKVGIAEPQAQVEAGPLSFAVYQAMGVSWSATGNASAPSNGNRSNDNTGVSLADPIDSTRQSVQVGNNANATYGIGETINTSLITTSLVDVIPPFPSGGTVAAIRYSSGNTGNCVIVPSQSPTWSVDNRFLLGSLRRGALLDIGGEKVLVQAVTPGPQGQMAIFTSSNGTLTAGANISGVSAVVLYSSANAANTAMNSSMLSSNISTGIGKLTQVLSTNPFATTLFLPSGNNATAQADDYVHLSVNFSDPTQLIQLMIVFSLETGGNNYNGEAFYYAVRPGDLVDIQSGNGSVLPTILQAAENEIIGSLPTPENIPPPGQSSSGNNQWAEILFPVSSLTRLGGDRSKTLANVTGVQLQVNVSNNITFQFGSLWVGGGGQPDIGNNGAEYRYQCVPLSSLTGVRGNPTPLMRYGAAPRRQPVRLQTGNLNTGYDPQIDTWEIYRYGGTITSYRSIGTTPAGSDFVDNAFDDAAAAGTPLVIDNTQPWPTIDVPWKVTSGNANINAVGPYLTVTGNNSIFPATIASWLPGTIFQVGGNEAFTLRARPTTANNGYLFEMEECIGSGNQSQVFVLEPNVAAQPLPYLWGPNEQGYFFGCGDPFRPGVVSWCKAYMPDSVPTGYDLDLCPPSEPLLGGEVIRGISLVASSKRWWQLYFQPGGNPLYNPVEAAIGKRLASPWGKCTDGALLYFWATDCIAATDGGPAKSLTDADLYNLFPHGGLSGVNVTRGTFTYYAPDYSRAAYFRLAVREGLLYADYRDSTNTPRTLVMEVPSNAWVQDSYANPITVHYSIEQPKGTLEAAAALFPAVVMGDNNGNVWKVQDLTNDGGNNAGTPISAAVGTFEFDGGDHRAQYQWGDLYVDLLAPNGATATPISLQAAVGNNTAIVANSSRQFVPVSLGGELLEMSLGLQVQWTDNFNNNAVATKLHFWQPSFVPKPETITTRFGDWYNFGQASYVRGCVMHADTYGLNKNLSIRNSDNNGLVQPQGGTLLSNNNVAYLPAGQINHNGEQEIAYFFTPFVAHMVRDEPQDSVPWRKFGMEWIKDPWPELTDLSSPWLSLGAQGAKYLRGAVMPIDTNGQEVSLTFLSSDGGNSTVGPFTTTAAEKTAVPWSFAIPLVGHDFQLIPSGPIRVWYDEIRWDFDAWPELIREATGWMPVLPGGGAAFLQGLVLPIETAGALPRLNLLTDTGLTIALQTPVTPVANIKTGVPYSLATPVVCHQVQILPDASCRVWLAEIQWMAEPTPELVSTWTTQWTALGIKGFKHIPRIEAAWASAVNVRLTIEAYDGTSPQVITLSGTGNAMARQLITLTMNKGQLYRFSATSAQPFQIFAQDFLIWAAEWGRVTPATPRNNLGAVFGDGARI